MTAYAEDIVKLGDQIAGLTLKEAVSLEEYLKSEYGIEAAQPEVDFTYNGASQPGKIEEEEVQTTFDVVLKSCGEKKINVIKVVRALTGLGLKEAKELVEAAPKIIKEGLPKEEANKMKADIEAAGGVVELK